LAEYFVTPNVAPAANMNMAAPAANAAPAHVAPAMTAPMFAAPAAAPVAPYGRTLSAEAILVLFILLVIVTRLCRV